MANIMYKDTDGNKSALLPKGNLGYDDYSAGDDEGRVYVGTGTENIKQLSMKDMIDDDTMAAATADNIASAESVKAYVDATDVYDNTTSGLTAVTVVGAIDEIEGRVDTAETKLTGVEDNATADQTGAEIKIAYEAEVDTNALTDARAAIVDATTLTGKGITDAYTKTEVDTALAAQNEASEISYSNTASGLTATDTQSAIDEVETRVDELENRELTNKVDATVAPAVTDDSDAGYEVGSLWVDTVADEAYRCADATVGAAVWVNTTLTTDEISSLLVSHDASGSQHTATTVKGAIEESAVLNQTSTTETSYTDAGTATTYKMYVENGNITLEEL